LTYREVDPSVFTFVTFIDNSTLH